ncbi:hypothetical protein GGR06_004027 [Bacteroides reticulotermitis]|uniref:Uncharacterized protein n=1 Tax=Bacteroides reticulotermitis TaxID=1133319 RepID=A0A840D3K9_9BACE|nr:hypothetical protein [Bacteroides reticulotermitis]
MLEVPKKTLPLQRRLFVGIAPQNAEIRTVAKSLPKSFQNTTNALLVRE